MVPYSLLPLNRPLRKKLKGLLKDANEVSENRLEAIIDLYEKSESNRQKRTQALALESEDNSCRICHKLFDDTIKLLPCGHAFHPDCLVGWIKNGGINKCPLCPCVLWETSAAQ